jgi:uroporphyrinogen-III synthase
MRLIVTRPEPDAERTARALIALGREAILSPMLDIVLDPDADIPDADFQAVLVTSANAVRALAAHRRRSRIAGLPLLAVGDGTALEAKRAGFSARSAGGAVDDLAALAAATLDPAGGPLLYAAGERRAGDLAGRLAAAGFSVETAIAYRAEPRSRLSRVAADALRQNAADGVLLYSRESAKAFTRALEAEGLAPLSGDVACFCISAAAAEPLAEVPAGPVVVAERPDQISLFAAIERFAKGGG